MLHPSLFVASLILVGLALAHSWLGERRLIGPLLADANGGMLTRSRFARQVLRFAWHLTSVAFVGLAAPLAVYAFHDVDGAARLSLRLAAVCFVAMGALILWSSRGRHLAWPLFMGAGALAALA
jgi:hypothetical protein